MVAQIWHFHLSHVTDLELVSTARPPPLSLPPRADTRATPLRVDYVMYQRAFATQIVSITTVATTAPSLSILAPPFARSAHPPTS